MRPDHPWRNALTLLAAGLLAAGSISATEGPRFELASEPDKLVIAMTEVIGQVESDDHPSVKVYADGRVVSHRPAYFTNPGDFTIQLSAAQLRSLVQSLVDRGVVDFDADAVRSQLHAAARAKSTVSDSSDVSVFKVELRLEIYQPPDSDVPHYDVAKALRWQGLRGDARRHPEIQALSDLLAVCTKLLALGERAAHQSAGGVQ